MTFLYIILSVAGSFCLCGMWFGLCVLCSSLLKKCGAAARFAPLAASAPFATALYFTAGFIPQEHGYAQILPCGAAALFSAAAAAAIATRGGERRRLFGKELFWSIADGAFMEIPQRLFMHGALFALLSYCAVPNAAVWAIFCNGTVWCLGIAVQASFAKERFCKALFAELCASFIFSAGVGFAYMQSGSVPLCMAAHAAERAISNAIAKK